MIDTPLNQIKIAGFKSIKQQNLQLKNINILLGANGSGKSNFISVFSFIQHVLDKDLQVEIAECSLPSLLYKGRKVTSRIEMEVLFKPNSYGFELTPTDDNRLRFAKEYYGYNGTKCIITESTGLLESHYEDGVGNLIDHYVKPVLQMRSWRVYHFNDTSRSSLIKQEHNISDNLALHQDASNLAAFLLRLRENHQSYYDDIVETIRIVAPYFNDFILEAKPTNPDIIVLRWKQFGSDEVLNANQFSDGTLRFICLTTLFKQPSELQPSAIIIDEPELGLHPAAISILAEMIHSVSKQKQIIISTQSVELVNEFEPEDIIITERGDSGTEFRRLSEDELKVWLEDDYSLGELWKKNLLGGRPW